MKKHTNRGIKICYVGIVIALLMMIVGRVGLKRFFVRPEEKVIDVQKKITLPILISGGDASWKSCVSEVAGKYMEEHPEVKVAVRAATTKKNKDYAKALLEEEALGNFQGIVEMKNAVIYAEKEKILPLPKELTKEMRAVDEVQGKVYSISRYYTGRCFLYNKKIFQEYGLEEPQTYEEFLTVCKTLKEHGVTPLTVGGKDLWHLGKWSNGLFRKDVQIENPDWLEKCSQGEVAWTDKEPKRMLTDFQNLFTSGYVVSDFAETEDAGTIEKLVQSEAAMLYSETTLFSQVMKADSDFELGYFFFPNDESESQAELDSSWGWTIATPTEGTKVYDAAVDFLKFYYREDIYQRVLQEMNGISSLKKAITYEAIPVQKQLLEQVKKDAQIEKDVWTQPEVPEGFSNLLHQNMRSMAVGEQSVEETAEYLEQGWRRLSEEEK